MDFSIFRLDKENLIYDTATIEYYVDKLKTNSCAFELENSVSLRLFLPRALATTDAAIEIFYENKEKIYRKISLFFEEISDGKDVFIAELKDFSVGLYFYRICIRSAQYTLFGYGTHRSIHFTFDEIEPTLQLAFSEFKYPIASNEYGGIIYHIFVDRFAKGGNYPIREGAIVDADFKNGIPEFPIYPGAPLKNNTFYGGTLKGIEEKLPYLVSLGVTLIYLSPIFSSPSNHKYDTANYLEVDAMFGGENALRELIQKAQGYGIGIILDGVFNHTGADSIYFNRYGTYQSIGAYQSTNSPYYNWYRFEKHPDKYTCWWGIEILPRIHPEEPSLCEFITGQDGVVEKYRKMGIRGFRLDVVDELSDLFVEKIKTALHHADPSPSLLFGEVWEDASNKIAYDKRKRYYLGSELDGVMNYPVRDGIISYLKSGECDKLRYALEEVLENTPIRIRNMQMNLLGSHDTVRILTALAGRESDGYSNAQLRDIRMNDQEYCAGVNKLKMAYTVLATIPGLPTIYYGDEAGLEGYSDPFNRMPFPWDNVDEEIKNHYVKIGQIRRMNDVYSTGDFEIHLLEQDLFVFSRKNKRHSYVTIINNTNDKLYVSSTRKHISLLDNKTRFETTLQGYSSCIIRVLHGTQIDFLRTKD